MILSHCGNLGCEVVVMGHQRRFERPQRMSALPPIATELLHYGKRR
jgi:hypothetical protein